MGVSEVDQFCDRVRDEVMSEGVGVNSFINHVVPAFGFLLRDGTRLVTTISVLAGFV